MNRGARRLKQTDLLLAMTELRERQREARRACRLTERRVTTVSELAWAVQLVDDGEGPWVVVPRGLTAGEKKALERELAEGQRRELRAATRLVAAGGAAVERLRERRSDVRRVLRALLQAR